MFTTEELMVLTGHVAEARVLCVKRHIRVYLSPCSALTGLKNFLV